MDKSQIIDVINNGKAVMGLEFGSTRIKAVLINEQSEVLASGSFEWENELVNGIWTYSLDRIHKGLQDCYADLKRDVKEKYGVTLKKMKAMGISAMMHGYLAFDKNGNLLVPFRTWRNTITGAASEELSKLFDFPVPERWSISHLYQAILNNEEHVAKLDSVYTLAAYIHFMLTGKKVIGIGDASGMFPIDMATGDYNQKFLAQFDKLMSARGANIKVTDLFPKVLSAGANAGSLTAAGAKFIDPAGDLEAGIPLCPPEGDAGTGMAATNSVKDRTGNISAGTSVFAMVVLEKDLKGLYPGIIDVVTTPDGKLVAMVHANNCTGEFNYWMNFLGEVCEIMGHKAEKGDLFQKLFAQSFNADEDCGGLLIYNYLSGETITGMNSGRPMFVRSENAKFNVANFMRTLQFSALGALRKGMDILFEKENVIIDSMTGAGGLFKTDAGLKNMAASLHTPISVMETAGEGGPWGMAVLANYMGVNKPLADYLDQDVFATCKKQTAASEKSIEDSFNIFYNRYIKGLAIEQAAVENL